MDLAAYYVARFPMQFLTVFCVVVISLIFLLGWLIRSAIRRVNKPKIDDRKKRIAELPDSDRDKAELSAEVDRLEAQGRLKGYRYVLACLPPVLWLAAPLLLAGAAPVYPWESVLRALRLGITSWYMIPISLLFIVLAIYLWFGGDSTTYKTIFAQRKFVWLVFGLVVVGLVWFIPSILLDVSEQIGGLHAMTLAVTDAIDESSDLASELEEAARRSRVYRVVASDSGSSRRRYSDVDAKEYINGVERWASSLDDQFSNVLSVTHEISGTVARTFSPTNTFTVSHTQQAIFQIHKLGKGIIRPHIGKVLSLTHSIRQDMSGTIDEQSANDIDELARWKLEFLTDEINDNVASLQPTIAVLTLNRTVPFLLISALFVVFLLIPWFLYLSFILGRRGYVVDDRRTAFYDLGLQKRLEEARPAPGNDKQSAALEIWRATSMLLKHWDKLPDVLPTVERLSNLAQALTLPPGLADFPDSVKRIKEKALQPGDVQGGRTKKHDISLVGEYETVKTIKETAIATVLGQVAFYSREYVIPLVILTLLTLVGWYYVILPDASAGLIVLIQRGGTLREFTRQLTAHFTVFTMTFTGAWLFMTVMLTYRWVTNDLYPKSYLYASMRLVYALLVGLIFAALFRNQAPNVEGDSHLLLLVLAFAVGAAPLEFVRALFRWLGKAGDGIGDFFGKLRQDILKEFKPPDWGSRHPLTDLEGLTIWDDTRLYTEGIQNVHALATVDLARLMIHTRFDAQQLVDWVDQALLFIHVKDLWRPGMSALGIRTATDLFDACQDEKEKTDKEKAKRVVDAFNHAQLMSLGTVDPRYKAYIAAGELETAAEALGQRATAVKAAADKLDKDKPETLDNVIALREGVNVIASERVEAVQDARDLVYTALKTAGEAGDENKLLETWKADGTIAQKLSALIEPRQKANEAVNDKDEKDEYKLTRKKLKSDSETVKKAAQDALEEAKTHVGTLSTRATEAKDAVKTAKEDIDRKYGDAKAITFAEKADALEATIDDLSQKVKDAKASADTLTKENAKEKATGKEVTNVEDLQSKLEAAETARANAETAAAELVKAAEAVESSLDTAKSKVEGVKTQLGNLRAPIQTAVDKVKEIKEADEASSELVQEAKNTVKKVSDAVGTKEQPGNDTVMKAEQEAVQVITGTDPYKQGAPVMEAKKALAEVEALDTLATSVNDIAKELDKDNEKTWDNVKALHNDLKDLKEKVEEVGVKRKDLEDNLEALKAGETLALRQAKKQVKDLATSTDQAKTKVENAVKSAFKDSSADDVKDWEQEKLKNEKQKVTDAATASETLKTSAADVAEEAMRTSLPLRLTEGILETMLESMKRDPNIAYVCLFWQRRQKRARESGAETSTVLAEQAWERRTALAGAEEGLRVHKERANELSEELAQKDEALEEALEKGSELRAKLEEQDQEHNAESAQLKQALEEEKARRGQAEETASEARVALEEERSLATLTASILEIAGIGTVSAQTLKDEAGITTVRDLLEACATPKQRNELATKTHISQELLLTWANMADLFRIRGVAERHADLLEMAGVDTVVEMAQRNPENLYARLAEVNAEKNLARKLPTQKQVSDWVAEAKALPRILTY